MEAFLEREEATTSSRLVGFLPGEPPKINLVDSGTDRRGLNRHFAQQIVVPDPDLFARLQAEVRVGDDIRVTIVNEYRETGSRAYLADFRKIPTAERGAAVVNGTADIVQNDITEINIPPVHKSKSKAQH